MPWELSRLTAANFLNNQVYATLRNIEWTQAFISLYASVPLVRSNYNEMLACD